LFLLKNKTKNISQKVDLTKFTSVKYKLWGNKSVPWIALNITQTLAWISEEKTINFHCLW